MKFHDRRSRKVWAHKWALAALATALLPALAACPGALPSNFCKGKTRAECIEGGGGTGGTGGGETCDAPKMVFEPHFCSTGSACHGTDSMTFDLSKGESSLLGKTSPTGPAVKGTACEGQSMTGTAGSVDDGVFIKRMTGDTCGDRMPPGGLGGFLTDTELDCVRKWLNAALQPASAQALPSTDDDNAPALGANE